MVLGKGVGPAEVGAARRAVPPGTGAHLGPAPGRVGDAPAARPGSAAAAAASPPPGAPRAGAAGAPGGPGSPHGTGAAPPRRSAAAGPAGAPGRSGGPGGGRDQRSQAAPPHPPWDPTGSLEPSPAGAGAGAEVDTFPSNGPTEGQTSPGAPQPLRAQGGAEGGIHPHGSPPGLRKRKTGGGPSHQPVQAAALWPWGDWPSVLP